MRIKEEAFMPDTVLRENLKSGAIEEAERPLPAAKPLLPRRFYQNVQVAPAEAGRESETALAEAPVAVEAAAGPAAADKRGGAGPAEAGFFAVLLDGRAVKTPARRPLMVPSRAVAEWIAEEFRQQKEHINPALMPITRLANTVIDGLAEHQQPVREDILRYSACDMLFYRADSPRELAEKQTQSWDKVLDWAGETMGVEFQTGTGLRFVTQKPEALAAVSSYLRQWLSPASADTPYVLAALHSMTCLTGSALLAFMAAAGALEAREAWRLAHIEEDWAITQWGQDEQAARSRAERARDFYAAAAVPAALKPA